MKTPFLISAFCALVVPCGASAEEYVQLSAYYYGDKPLFCFKVPLERVKRLPAWTGEGKPPLSRKQAVEISAKALALSTPPQRVELSRVDVNSPAFDGDVWYYLIEYLASSQSAEAHRRAVAVVLFDGMPVAKTQGDCAEFLR